MNTEIENRSDEPAIRAILACVSAVRWMLVLPFLALTAALVMYIAHLIHEAFAMFLDYWHNVDDQNVLLLRGLELLDMTLIAQLFVMTIMGGFAIFILPLDKTGLDLPQWLKHGLSTSDQKIKFGMSIINIMMVQFLDMFIKALGTSADTLWEREQLFACAVIGTLVFATLNLMMHPDMLRAKPSHADQH